MIISMQQEFKNAVRSKNVQISIITIFYEADIVIPQTKPLSAMLTSPTRCSTFYSASC